MSGATGDRDPRRTVLLAVLAIISLFALPRFSLRSSPGKSSPIQQAEEILEAAEELLKAPASGSDATPELQPLYDSLSDGKAKAATGKVIDERLANKPGRQPVVCNAFILTLPHPTESVMGYRFDDFFDSVQRALEMRGFALDRRRFPCARSKMQNPSPNPPRRPLPRRKTKAPWDRASFARERA